MFEVRPRGAGPSFGQCNPWLQAWVILPLSAGDHPVTVPASLQRGTKRGGARPGGTSVGAQSVKSQAVKSQKPARRFTHSDTMLMLHLVPKCR